MDDQWGQRWNALAPRNKLMQLAGQRSDYLYDPQGEQDFRENGVQRAYPTPPFVPSYAFRDPAFVLPPNQRARDLSFDQMDLADRQFYRDRTFGESIQPRMRRF